MSKRKAYIGATIINGNKDVPVIKNGTILVGGDGNIEAVGNNVKPAGKVEKVNVHGKYIMPGLINAHVHHFNSGGPMKTMSGLFADMAYAFMRSIAGKIVMKGIYEKNAKTFVNAGVTTVRDVGSFFDLDLKTRKKISKGKIDGPRILCSGPLIIPTGGHGFRMPSSYICDGPTECMRAVRYNYFKLPV